MRDSLHSSLQCVQYSPDHRLQSSAAFVAFQTTPHVTKLQALIIPASFQSNRQACLSWSWAWTAAEGPAQQLLGAMGWVSFLLTQAVVTSVTLGAMKRGGLIQVNSKNIQNDTVRYCLVKAVDFGEDVCIFGENLYMSLTNEIERAKRDRK